jgi:mRNA interferase RelE/StbE
LIYNIFNIVFTKKAEDQLKKLPKNIQIRVISVLKRISINPHNYVRRVVGTNFFRVRIGDYRAIIDINEKEITILVLFVAHRKNIYKNKF